MEKDSRIWQFLAGGTACLASLSVGASLGWTSPMSPVYSSNDTSISPLPTPPTALEASWIGSLVALGALVAPFIAGLLAEKWGRKFTLLAGSALFTVSWVLLLTTGTVGQILAARLLQGFGVGFVMTVLPMYVGEIASKEYRGAMGSLMPLLMAGGALYVYSIGPYVSYQTLQWACLALPITFMVVFFFMPETPTFYITKGQFEDAITSLRFLRGKPTDEVQEELKETKNCIENAMNSKASLRDLFQGKGNIKALVICVGLISFQQLSGNNVIVFYSQTIFAKTGSSLEPAISTISVCTVAMLAGGVTPLIADRFGRKALLLLSAAGMCLVHGTMGLYFYMDYIQSDAVNSMGWLPITSLIVFVTVFCNGFGSIPWIVLGEMFPANVKSIAASIVTSSCWVLGFLVLQFFSPLEEAVGSHWLFWIFGIMCALAFAFTLTVVLETKGLSLQQIQDKLNKSELK